MIVEFFCSVTGARFLERLLEEFRASGHTVKVIKVLSDDDYRRKKFRLEHFWVRWLIYGWYPLKSAAFLVLSSARHDTIRMTVTTPFYMPALVQLLSRKNVSTMCLMYDVFPDALVVAGKIARGSLLATMLALVTRHSIRRSGAIIYLGKHIMEHVERTYGPSKMKRVVPVGADGEFLNEQPSPVGEGQKIRIVYSGTMGHMHETETISTLLQGSVPAALEFHFYASGAKYEQFKSRVCGCRSAFSNQVSFSGSLSDDAWRRMMQQSEVSLVTMVPGSEKVIFPSKSYSSFMAGHAILAICPRNSDLADMIELHDCGWHVEPGDLESLRNVLDSMVSNKDELNRKRMNAYRVGHRLFDMSAVAAQYLEEASKLLSQKNPGANNRGS